MDLVLLLFVIIVPFLCLIASVYLFAYFSHSDEQDFAKSWITRIFTIFMIQFGATQQFFISLDIANAYSDGGIDWYVLFEIYYCALAFLMFIFLPFTTFYYETNEEISVKVRIKGASFRCVSYGLAVTIIMVVTYFILKGEDSQSFAIYIFKVYSYYIEL